MNVQPSQAIGAEGEIGDPRIIRDLCQVVRELAGRTRRLTRN